MLDAARLRKVLAPRGDYAACDDLKIGVVSSPDGRRALAFSHGREMTMMNMRWFFTLFDARGRMLEQFHPAEAVHKCCAWSPDSRQFAVAIAGRGEALLVVDLARRQFCAVRLSNRQCRVDFVDATTLRMSFEPSQLRAINQHDNTLPTVRFRAPEPRTVDTRRLRRHPLSRMRHLFAAVRAAPRLDMDPVRDGYFPFKGRYPRSTTSVIRGRQLEIFHLLAFAGHGDAQSQAWLEAIKRKAAHREISKWDRVSKYLGRRTRRNP